MNLRHGWMAVCAALALALPPQVLAERFRVDLILYQDKTGSGGESPMASRPPDLFRTHDPSDASSLRAAGIEVLPDEAFGLAKEWRNLSNSQKHHPLLRLAWIQRDPPSENGPGLRLRSGSPMVLNSSGAYGTRSSEIYPVDGSVRLLMGRYLHLDANLAYTISRPDADPASYRLKERRLMRRDELHHIDSPRLGLLVKVRKVDGGEKAKP